MKNSNLNSLMTFSYDAPALFMPFHLTPHAFEAVKAEYQGDHTKAATLYDENDMDASTRNSVRKSIENIYSRLSDRLPLNRFVCETLELDHLNMELELGDCLENYWAHNQGHLCFDICKETDKSLVFHHWVITTEDGKTANAAMFEERRKRTSEDKPTGKTNKVHINHSAYIEVRGSQKVYQKFLSKSELVQLVHDSKLMQYEKAWVESLCFAFSGNTPSGSELLRLDCLKAIEDLPWWKPASKPMSKPITIGKIDRPDVQKKFTNRVGKKFLVNKREGSVLTVVDWPNMNKAQDVVVVAGSDKLPGPCELVDMVIRDGEGVII